MNFMKLYLFDESAPKSELPTPKYATSVQKFDTHPIENLPDPQQQQKSLTPIPLRGWYVQYVYFSSSSKVLATLSVKTPSNHC